MNTDPRLEQRVAAALSRAASTREPDGLLDSVVSTVGRTRTRPRWLALIKEPPMRIHSRVAVGSPTVRLAYLAILTLLMTILATGAVVAGASLLTTPAIVVAQDGSGTVTTIAKGVAMAQDGDTVLVKPGTYLESIAITEDITLRGDGGKGDIVIEFVADGPTYGLDDEPFAYGILLDDSDASCALTRCDAAHARSSRANDRRGERYRVPRAAGHTGWRSPHVRRTTSSGPRAGRARSAASRQRDGTIVPRQGMTPRQQPRRRRSKRPERSSPRTGHGPHAELSMACRATTSGRASRGSPAGACRYPSRPTSVSRCCDDRWNSPRS